MSLDHKVILHPTRRQLVAYAESLVDRRTPISAAMAAHVAACPACAAEVKAVKASLEFTASAPGIEPSQDLTSQILLKAQQERGVCGRRARPVSRIGAMMRAVAFTGATAAVAVFVFGMALNAAPAGSHYSGAPAGLVHSAVSASSQDAMQRAAKEVQTLSAAVRMVSDRPQSPREREQRRMAAILDADIAAARQALQRNPGCERAAEIVNANLRRQAETLRALYLERSL